MKRVILVSGLVAGVSILYQTVRSTVVIDQVGLVGSLDYLMTVGAILAGIAASAVFFPTAAVAIKRCLIR